MLVYTPRAIDDLAHIMSGLVEFRINESAYPSLTKEHACEIYDDILAEINTIPSRPLHILNTFEGLSNVGQFVFTYKRNRTNWYAFYDQVGDDFILKHVSNNWLTRLPRL